MSKCTEGIYKVFNPTGAVLAVFRGPPEGGTVSVGSGEQHSAREAAGTVARSRGRQEGAELETHHPPSLQPDRLVRPITAHHHSCYFYITFNILLSFIYLFFCDVISPNKGLRAPHHTTQHLGSVCGERRGILHLMGLH